MKTFKNFTTELAEAFPTKLKPETIARHKKEAAEERLKGAFDLLKRLKQNADKDKNKDSIYAEMAKEHEDRLKKEYGNMFDKYVKQFTK